MESERVMRLSVDLSANAAYLHLQPATVIQPSVAETLAVSPDINLDFDQDGRLVGIEILAATTRLHPELLRDADRMS
jgi:uncharacterized protein YuzE